MCIFAGIVAGALYGVVNDQITITISPEYFSVFKHRQFLPLLDSMRVADAPIRVQAIVIGISASWWVGQILGFFVGIASAFGTTDPIPMSRVYRVLASVIMVTLVCSAIAGVWAFVQEPSIQPTADQWPFLTGISDVRHAFAVGAWHDTAYVSAPISTLAGCAWMLVIRKRTSSNANS